MGAGRTEALEAVAVTPAAPEATVARVVVVAVAVPPEVLEAVAVTPAAPEATVARVVVVAVVEAWLEAAVATVACPSEAQEGTQAAVATSARATAAAATMAVAPMAAQKVAAR